MTDYEQEHEGQVFPPAIVNCSCVPQEGTSLMGLMGRLSSCLVQRLMPSPVFRVWMLVGSVLEDSHAGNPSCMGARRQQPCPACRAGCPQQVLTELIPSSGDHLAMFRMGGRTCDRNKSTQYIQQSDLQHYNSFFTTVVIVCVCVWCMPMWVHVSMCVCVQEYKYHSVYVEVRAQPWMLVLLFHLVWGNISCLLLPYIPG